MLSSILPAVIANHVEFGVGGASEVVILSLDLGSLPVEKGYDAMLMDLAKTILKKLGDLEMSSSRGVQYLRDEVAEGSVSGSSISYIFQSLEVPILILVDEVQNLLVPRVSVSGEIDKNSQVSAGKLLKDLMCKSSSSCKTSPCHAAPKSF